MQALARGVVEAAAVEGFEHEDAVVGGEHAGDADGVLAGERLAAAALGVAALDLGEGEHVAVRVAAPAKVADCSAA